MTELLYGMATFDPSFLTFMSKEAWAHMIDDLFDHEHNTIFQALFLRILIKVFDTKDENLYLQVLIC